MPANIAYALIAVAAGLLLGFLLVRENKALVAARKQLMTLASELKSLGFDQLPTFLTNIVESDWAGCLREIAALIVVLRHPAKLQQEFARVLENLLKAALEDKNRRPAILKMVADLAAATATGATMTPDEARQLLADASDLAAAAAPPPPASLPTVPAGHTLTVAGPPAAPPAAGGAGAPK